VRARAAALLCSVILIAGALALSGGSQIGAVPVNTPFLANGTYPVPADVCSISVVAIGAQGGACAPDGPNGDGASWPP